MLEDKIITDTIVNNFVLQNNYADAAKRLLEIQKQSWEQCKSGYDSLDQVDIKEFIFDGFKIKIQYNPGRVISSTAKTDEKSISERECFLCYENLTEEQKGILFPEGFLVLCNPFPVFREHFVLPLIEHLPQRILNSFSVLLSFSKSLSKYYTIIYNGPECGASAPDHLHFQAGNKYFMPLDNEFDFLKNKYGVVLLKTDDLSITAVDDGLRKFISIESDDKIMVEKYFARIYDILPYEKSKEDEPKLNIISLYDNHGWRVLIFPREEHRPTHYFKKGSEKITLSPASIDMGGTCILPFEEDFLKITKEDIVDIFNEVIIPKDKFELLKEEMKISLAVK